LTFKSWSDQLEDKKQTILEKLKGKTVTEIVDYFDYDNMVENEPDYCVLYKNKSKCHDIKELNCFFCGCPYFQYSDDKPLKKENDIDIMSVCAIDSKFAKQYTFGEKAQCDCSDCVVPHKKHFVKNYISTSVLNMYKFEDTCSLLECIRAYQLNDILGKYKIF